MNKNCIDLRLSLRIVMFKVLTCLACMPIIAFSHGSLQADTIVTSASLGNSTTFGFTVNSSQYAGVRFTLTSPAEITSVGGNISSNGTLFAAVFEGTSLSTSGGPPFGGSPLAVATFVAGSPSSDVRVPLPVILQPGDYALVIGTGNFGATGTGAIPTRFHSQTATPDVTLISWNSPGNGWLAVDSSSGSYGMRLVVEGNLIENNAPVANAGENILVESTGYFTEVLLNASGSYDPDSDEISFEWSVPEGSGAVLDDPTSPTPIGQFPLGPTLVTLTVTDGNGGISIDDVLVSVVDTSPPVLICTTDLISLWPPSHDMRQVTVCIAVSDNCAQPGDLLLNARVSSSEPDDATGDGSSIGDVHGADGFSSPVGLTDLVYDATMGCYWGTVMLRAERDGANKGRTYSIVCDVMDTGGNLATASCVVVVPHSKKK